mmetsp:Transcript_6699/g.18377  ORF Transcript_6699/g.18377 Transcript_6699/m.18377 type:complete len:309 (-) Transcript_6699:41-967(-)
MPECGGPADHCLRNSAHKPHPGASVPEAVEVQDGWRVAHPLHDPDSQRVAIQHICAGKPQRGQDLVKVGLGQVMLLRGELHQPLTRDLAALVRQPAQGGLQRLDAGVLPVPVLVENLHEILQTPLCPRRVRNTAASRDPNASEHFVELLVRHTPAGAAEPTARLPAVQRALSALVEHFEGDLEVALTGERHGPPCTPRRRRAPGAQLQRPRTLLQAALFPPLSLLLPCPLPVHLRSSPQRGDTDKGSLGTIRPLESHLAVPIRRRRKPRHPAVAVHGRAARPRAVVPPGLAACRAARVLNGPCRAASG